MASFVGRQARPGHQLAAPIRADTAQPVGGAVAAKRAAEAADACIPCVVGQFGVAAFAIGPKLRHSKSSLTISPQLTDRTFAAPATRHGQGRCVHHAGRRNRHTQSDCVEVTARNAARRGVACTAYGSARRMAAKRGKPKRAGLWRAVRNLVARRLEDLTPLLGRLKTSGCDFD